MCPWWMSAWIQTSHTQRANDPRRLRVWTPANDTESCTQRHVFQPTAPPPHIDTPATLTKKNVIVAGVAWKACQWWKNWEGICEVEFSLSLSLLINFALYFSCSDTLRLPRTLYFQFFLWHLGHQFGRPRRPLDRTVATHGSLVKKRCHFVPIFLKIVLHLGDLGHHFVPKVDKSH